jgi:hypothetical protein
VWIAHAQEARASMLDVTVEDLRANNCSNETSPAE